MKNFKLGITEKHLEKALLNEKADPLVFVIEICKQCVIAEAAKEHFGSDDVGMGFTELRHADDFYICEKAMIITRNEINERSSTRIRALLPLTLDFNYTHTLSI